MPYEIETKDGIVIRGIPDNVKPDDSTVKAKVANARQARLAKQGATGGELMQSGIDPTEGNSFLKNTAIGAGKAVSDIGLGARQIASNIGIGDKKNVQAEVDERRNLDEPLMNTGGGITGNVAANIGTAIAPGAALTLAPKATAANAAGRYLLSSPATAGGLMAGAGQGAALSAVQPVATGESRAGNAAIGAAAGGIVPALGMALKSGKAVVEPLYEGGRTQILGRALRSAAGSGADDAARNLQNPRTLVPGSQPTAAEVAGSPGIAAMQRAASAVDPEQYGRRAIEQNTARVEALRGVAGAPGEKEFFEASRKTAAEKLYAEAYEKGVDITRNPETGRFLPKNEIAGVKGEITKLLKRPSIQESIALARKWAADEGVNMKDMGGSIKGLDYVKLAIDDKIQDAAPGSNQARILTDLKHRLLTTLDRLSPKYAEARTTFHEMSKPINELETGERIFKGATSALESAGGQPKVYGENLARAMRDADQTAQRATGFKGATMEKTMSPEKIAAVENVIKDLERSTFAQNAGRGVGSDTVQKLAMTNLMERSGLPVGINNFPGIGRIGNFAYSQADQIMKERLARALLNPKETAELMRAGITKPQIRAIAKALRAGGQPLAIGGASSVVNGQQQ